MPDRNIRAHLGWTEQNDTLDADKQDMMLTRLLFYKRKLYGEGGRVLDSDVTTPSSGSNSAYVPFCTKPRGVAEAAKTLE